MDLADSPEEAAFRARVRAWLAEVLPIAAVARAVRAGRQAAVLASVAAPVVRRRLRGHLLATRVRRIRGGREDPVHLHRGSRPGRGTRAAQHGGGGLRRAHDRRVRHRGAEAALPAPDPDRRGAVVSAVLRAGVRFGSCFAAHQSDAGRGRVAPGGAEDLDQPGPPRGERHPARAHRRRRPRHRGITYFLLPMDSPGVTVRPLRHMLGRGRVQRGLPGRRVRAGRAGGRRRRRRVDGRHGHPRPSSGSGSRPAGSTPSARWTTSSPRCAA